MNLLAALCHNLSRSGRLWSRLEALLGAPFSFALRAAKDRSFLRKRLKDQPLIKTHCLQMHFLGLKLKVLGLALGCLVGLPALPAQPDLESTRTLLHQWIKTEKKIAEAESHWVDEEEALKNIIEVLKGEIVILEGKITESREEISKADERRAALGVKREALIKASGVIQEIIAGLEQKVRDLYPLFPRPLQRNIEQLYSRMPKPNEEMLPSLSTRMQNVVGILLEVDKFNGSITLDTTLRQLEEGKTREIKTLYLGIACAYFTSAEGAYAGYGTPTEKGWKWIVKPDWAPAIAQAIKVYEDPQKASYVYLPVTIE